MTKITYVVDANDVEKMKESIREAFRQELGIEVDFVVGENGELNVKPAKRPKGGVA